MSTGSPPSLIALRPWGFFTAEGSSLSSAGGVSGKSSRTRFFCPVISSASAPLATDGACRSHVMNSPKSAAAVRQSRPVLAHQRKYNATHPAYDLVVNCVSSRPSRTYLKKASAAGTTANSSSSTVQYFTPDGITTGNVRTVVSLLGLLRLSAFEYAEQGGGDDAGATADAQRTAGELAAADQGGSSRCVNGRR